MLVFPVSARAGILRGALRAGRLRGRLEGLRESAEFDRADPASGEIPRQSARGADRHRVAGTEGERRGAGRRTISSAKWACASCFTEWLDAATAENGGGRLARRPLSLFRRRRSARLENRLGQRARKRAEFFEAEKKLLEKRHQARQSTRRRAQLRSRCAACRPHRARRRRMKSSSSTPQSAEWAQRSASAPESAIAQAAHLRVRSLS